MGLDQLQHPLDANSQEVSNLGDPLAATSATKVTTSVSDIKPVGTVASLGSSFLAAPADHVHAGGSSSGVTVGQSGVVDFSGNDDAVLITISDAGVVTASNIVATIQPNTGTDMDELELSPLSLNVGNIINGVSFDVLVTSLDGDATGQFLVNYIRS